MRHEIDKIEIKEPPIEELNKKRSCVKRSCTTGCGCLVLIFLFSIAMLYFTVGPRSRELKDLPSSFTENVPLYDAASVDKISYTPSRERGRRIELIAYIPKILLAPFVIYFDTEYTYIPRDCADCSLSTWEKFIAFVTDPVTDQRDLYKIEWTNLTAKQDYIVSYYITELGKKNYEIKNQSTILTSTQFQFRNNDIEGTFYTDDDPQTNETDIVTLTITIPPTK